MSCRHAHEDTESGINLFISYLRCDTARGYTGNPREIGGSCTQGGMFLYRGVQVHYKTSM